MWCIPTTIVEKFKKALKSKEIDPAELAKMTSEARRGELAKIFGEANAHNVNRLFEQNLLLKSRKRGAVKWAKEILGMSKKAQKDFVSKVERMTEVLKPEDEKMFYEDLAAHKLGVSVSLEEAGKISDLAKETNEKKAKIKEDSPVMSEERMAYGRVRVDFSDYVSDLKNESKRMTFEDIKTAPLGAIGRGITELGGITKSLKASLDNSVIGRQGLKTLIIHPKIWAKNARQSFMDIFNTFKGEDVMREVRADVLSRPNSLNGLYAKEKLAIGVTEEAYPSALPEKIPFGLGKAFKASEAAFTAFQYRTRADVFDKLVEIAEKSGAEIEGLGKVANSLTGRGNVGTLEPVANKLNNIFFSPRFLKSNIDILTGQGSDWGSMGPFARKQAAKNTIKFIGVIGLGLFLLKSLADALGFKDPITFDPRSSDFGKLKLGNTRFDLSGGTASIITLISRISTLSTKSSSTGIVKKLNTGDFNAPTVWTVFQNFAEGKLSPIASVIRDLAKGKDWNWNKPTLAGEINNALTPMIISTAVEGFQATDSVSQTIAIALADFVGIGANTYINDAKDIVSSANSVTKEAKRLFKTGDRSSAKKLIEKNKENLKKAKHLKASVEYVNKLEKKKREIEESVKISDSRKKELKDSLDKKIKAKTEFLKTAVKKIG